MPALTVRIAFAALLGAMAISSPARANDMDNTDGPDLSAARAAIKAKNYDAALVELKPIVANSQHPDALSLMGYTLRKTGDRAQAMTYYDKALQEDPTHKGALEYQGELYVEIGQIDKANENLARLSKLCWPTGCEEVDDLKKAIAQGPSAKTAW